MNDEMLEIPVLYEDKDLLVVDKPGKLPTHVDERSGGYSLAQWIAKRNPECRDVGGFMRVRPNWHTLRSGMPGYPRDGMSGVVLVAKNMPTFTFLCDVYQGKGGKEFSLTYDAFVSGVLSAKEGIIDLPVGGSRVGRFLRAVGEHIVGTAYPATTRYRVERSSPDFSFLEISLMGGRRHQIRLHLKEMGHPILCDDLYGGITGLGFSRLALHLRKVRILLPTGLCGEFTAPLPKDFQQALKELSQ